MPSLSDVDLNDLEVFQQGTPHHWFELLRRESPVHRHAGAPGEEDYWCITRYEDLKWISKSPQLFSSERKGAILRDAEPEALPRLRLIMLNMDPPKHRLYRSIVNKAFTPRMVKGLERRVSGMVDDIIDAVVEKGECDFVEDLAAPLPMLVICEMMGVPEEDRKSIYEIGNRMVGFDDPDLGATPEARENPEAASAEMFAYAEKLKERARTHPGDDLATALLHAEVDGQRLSDLEYDSFFMLLVIAGNETTRTVTSNGMIQLIRHADQRRRVVENPKLVPSMVEEILRYDPAVHSFRRTAMADTEIRGQKIAEGDKVALWYPSVNRDEDVFPDPHTFDVARHPNDHLAFGIGEHYCLGANLARMELRKIFAGLLARLPDIEFAAEPRRLRSNFINGVKEMRVTFSPGPRKRKAA